MIGTKRRNVSFSSNLSDDTNNNTSFQRKMASPLGGQATEGSPLSVGDTAGTPSLDRRKAARQHVRALNTEFASWVQTQLRDHPDELWEDGAKAYLDQASEILEKFTDVVTWLKANTGRESNASISGTQSNERKGKPQTNSNDSKSAPAVFTFGNASPVPTNSVSSVSQSSLLSSTTSSTATFTFGLSASSQAFSQSASAAPVTSWSSGVSFDAKSLAPVKTVSFSATPTFGLSSNSQPALLATSASVMSSTSSGLFSNSQMPSFGSWNSGASSTSQSSFTFGNQNSTALNDSVKEDADGENEPEQPSSPSVKSSEEKGITVVLETKCKLYIKSTDPSDKEPWKDKGAGKLFIKCLEDASKGTKESKPRILVRNDVGRIMLNASLYPGIKTHLQKNAIVTIFHTSDDSGENGKALARTFLIRVKNEEERNKLADTIREHAPAA